jgi:hypothetical protein
MAFRSLLSNGDHTWDRRIPEGPRRKISPSCVKIVAGGICRKTSPLKKYSEEVKALEEWQRYPKERDEEKDSIEIQKGGSVTIPEPFRTGPSLLSCIKEG